ncbi:D-hexose-6-phosphate mutarotase [Piscinibacter sakaiensis]|uniref:D-hexose-6-phosphate mutarotase n=1 Tax=Piscinibacter sakaiensis TaxID=1547922 RepID=UPI003AACF1CC
MVAITLSEYNGLDAVQLRSGDGSCATVLLHGAQVVSWQPAGKGEQLYLSPSAVFDGRTAVRGGVPVIFPQFDQRGTLPRHGFARNRRWRPLSIDNGASDALAVLRLVDDDDTMAIWPHRFIAELSVHLSPARLDIELSVEHREPEDAAPPAEPLRFTAALHSYLRVGDAAAAHVDGLQRLRFFDKVRSTEQVDMAPQLTPAGELDRIYFDVARPLVLRDGERRITIENHGFDDVVVWNPGPELARRLDDLPDDGWREMLCIEAAAIGRPVEVRPGDCWIGRQTIKLEQPEA